MLQGVTMPHRVLMPCTVTDVPQVMMPHRVMVPHGVTMLYTVSWDDDAPQGENSRQGANGLRFQ